MGVPHFGDRGSGDSCGLGALGVVGWALACGRGEGRKSATKIRNLE